MRISLLISFGVLLCTSNLSSAYGQKLDTLVLSHDLTIAAKAKFRFKWGDSEYMELHSNKKIYTLKKGLEDGIYIAVFDEVLDWNIPIKDTALVATMLNGRMHGLLQRWDDLDKTLAEECEYKNGLIDGYRKLYFFAPDGKKYTNIEFYSKGLPVKTIQIEW